MTKVAAIVLAAGSSRRFGAENKLLATVDGKPVLQHVLDRITPLALARKIVVVKPDDEAVVSLVDRAGFDVVENAAAVSGMGSSIAAGIRACSDVDGAFLMLGDMPYVQQATWRQLLAAFHDHADKTVIAPTYRGQRGHPVLLRRRHFDALMALDEDMGAKTIIAANPASLLGVPVNDAGILSDVDVPEDATP